MKTILYILGYGRSGSTLLSRLLHCHQQVLSVGELGRLPHQLINNKFPKYCGCRKLFSRCTVWGNIFDQTLKKDLINLSFTEWNLFLLEELFKTKPNASVIVDSSCDFKRLLHLQKANITKNYHLKILFLSRDSRGVIHSTSNKGYGNGKWKQPLLRAIISWYIRNRQYINIFSKSEKNRILHIKYEELVNDTSNTLRDIHKFINIKPMPLVPNWNQNPPHTFAGNIGLIKSKSNKIVEDKSWEKGLTRTQLFLTELVTGRLNKKLLKGLSKV